MKVSEIGLGSWLTYGHGVDDATSRACIRRAYELGINFFDTADVYARGAAETCYGRELSEFRRRDLVIATKCFFPMSDHVNDRGLSRKHIFESIHDSLARLRTDYVDLYQCHRYDSEVEVEEVVRAMEDLIRQGKILYWGVSEWSAAQIESAVETARELGCCRPVSNQPEYSVAARRIETNGVQGVCVEHGIGNVVWSPLKQGMLTGKYAGQKRPEGSRIASEKMNAFLKEVNKEVVERAERMRPMAERHGATLAQLSIAWILRRPAISSVIVGASRVEQVEENAAAVKLELPDGDVEKMANLFPAKQFQ